MGDKVRGPVAERVLTSTPQDPFLTLKAASEYTGLSKSGLLRAVKASRERALPCYTVGRKILVRRSELDRWLETFRTRGRPKVAAALAKAGLSHL